MNDNDLDLDTERTVQAESHDAGLMPNPAGDYAMLDEAEMQTMLDECDREGGAA